MVNPDWIIVCKFILGLLVVYLYYRWIKMALIKLAPTIAHFFKLTKHYSLSTASGAVELPLIAVSHFIFCVFLARCLHVSLFQFSLFKISFYYFILAILLGIGMMGFSTLLCQAGIAIFQLFSPSESKPIESWVALAKGGWLRHHSHTLQVLPYFLALLFIMLQIASEEMVFRGVFLKYFLSFGKMTAIILSTALFVLMQKFFMPSRLSAMFPMMGALVMGLVHAFLYTRLFLLMPLIVAHFVFFSFSVL